MGAKGKGSGFAGKPPTLASGGSDGGKVRRVDFATVDGNRVLAAIQGVARVPGRGPIEIAVLGHRRGRLHE